MPKPLSSLLLICEKVLQEKDDLVSVVRIADIFQILSLPDVTPEKQAVLMNILVMCKFAHDDESKHLFTLRLTRPDGTEKDVDFGRPLEVDLSAPGLKPKIPESPRGFNLIGPWAVRPTHMGLHQLSLFVDGEKVAVALFTLAPQPAPVSE